MLLEGTMTCKEIADHFKGEAGVESTIKRHRNGQHGINRQLKQAKASRDAKAGLELAECIKEVWSDSQEAIDYALGRKAPPEKNPLNLNVFGQCIAPRTKIIEILAKVDDKPEVTQTNITNNYDNLSKEELRELVALTTKIEGSEEGVSEEKPG